MAIIEPTKKSVKEESTFTTRFSLSKTKSELNVGVTHEVPTNYAKNFFFLFQITLWKIWDLPVG
jgi:hypothetical protein